MTYDEKAKQNKTRERLQAFEGVCIARQGAGLNESFTVRKVSYGEGVERVFPVYSPLVDSVVVVRKGKVRRAKLYYLRGRTGKSARISERIEVSKPSRRRLKSHKIPVNRAARAFLARPDCFWAAKKARFFRLFRCISRKCPNFLRFFDHHPLYLAGNAVKSGSSLIC